MTLNLNDRAVQRAPSLASQAYETLKKLIVEGSIEAGAVLSENDLARRLGISRSPLREAIRRLQDEDLLDESGPRGFRVPPITVEFVRNLYQVRRAIEVEAAGLAHDIPPASLAAMRGRMTEISAQIDCGDTLAFTASDFEFHNLFIEAAGNPMLAKFAKRLNGPVRRVHIFANPLIDHIRTSFDEHLVMLRAMEVGDSSALRKATEAHISNVADRLITHIDDTPTTGIER